MGDILMKREEILRNCPLYRNISDEDLHKAYNCMGGHVMKFSKNQIILEEGGPAGSIGIVLSGSVQTVRDDYNGNRVIINHLETGDIFAEAAAVTELTRMPVTIVAGTDCHVFLVDSNRVMNPCHKNCSFHINLIKNLLNVVAIKNIWLTHRIEITSCRTTREKIMAFLLIASRQYNSREFTIPFNRQELADFLGVERSAMSAEISRLRADGIIESNRSWFKIL